MRYLSVCSGIEAASVAWGELGWHCAGLAEVDPFARAVLAHRFPDTPLHGDFTNIRSTDGPVDLLVGGPPCQSYSVSGRRGGMGDKRGRLTLEFARLAGRLRPRWVVFENVPNLLRTGGGRDFGEFLRAMGDGGYQCAWRVLDAQHFGVPQRRRRLFVVGHLGGPPGRSARVLFERQGVRRDSPARRATGTEVAGALTTGAGSGGYKLDDCQVGGGHIQPVAFDLTQCTHPENRCRFDPGAPVGSLQVSGKNAVAYNVFPAAGQGSELRAAPTELATQITAAAGAKSSGRGTRVAGEWGVRRLTPREWERLQGFPDDWTLVPWRGGMAPKTRRYKAIGNSMAVPVMRYIGKRIRNIQRTTP